MGALLPLLVGDSGQVWSMLLLDWLTCSENDGAVLPLDGEVLLGSSSGRSSKLMAGKDMFPVIVK